MATILVVEDNPANMKLARVVLEKAGHTVLAAGEGEAGVQLAREHAPDLILMDVQMPGMDGLTATGILKGDPQTRGIPIIALTAFAMKGDAEKVLAAGCDGYVTKPFHYPAFLSEVSRMLDRSKAP